MVSKLILDIQDTPSAPVCTNEELLAMNARLHQLVIEYKNKINNFYKNKTWDKYKKLSNEYEMIFTSPSNTTNISTYMPVSRSFFKLWEVLQDFEDAVHTGEKRPLKAVFLAEGPGGFTEAFCEKRKGHKDECYGITLKANTSRHIPDWKLPSFQNLNLKVHYGKDGTGNLYSLANIEHFVRFVGEGTADLVTADGGFDFSSDFNHQEELSYRLILCEVLCAVLLQARGGAFLLKTYDCFSMRTIKLIHVLKRLYGHVHFIKPLTSRPANSERYLLCTDFLGHTPAWEELTAYMKVVVDLYETDRNAEVFEQVPLHMNVLYNIVLYNYYYTMRQIYYIQRTINFIQYFTKGGSEEVFQAILDKHEEKSREWCTKYNIPFKARP